MKKRYYIDGKMFGSDSDYKKTIELNELGKHTYIKWRQSITPLQCDHSELSKIQSYHQMTILRNEPIDVTKITYVKSGKVWFKEVESEVNEAIFAHWILHNYKPYEDGMTMVWRNINPDIDTLHTSKELYEIFKTNPND